MEQKERELWRHEFRAASGQKKTLRVVLGDLCDAEGRYDVVVCSAFRDNYRPTRGTLVGALWERRGISVTELAREPELDLKAMGCWLSRELEGTFRRIACVELLTYQKRHDQRLFCSALLKGAFSTLRFVLEQADLRGIPVSRVALPLLGTGNQKLAVADIAGPLINQCLRALETVEGLECITFYERRLDRLMELTGMLEQMVHPPERLPCQVFISYSHYQLEQAARIRQILERRGLRCWMAPGSIPTGSDYSREIPVVLHEVRVLVLLLTPEAEFSNWVHKEVAIAIGNGRKVVPYQPEKYRVGEQFRFLLEGIQILPGWEQTPESGLEDLADRIQRMIPQRVR